MLRASWGASIPTHLCWASRFSQDRTGLARRARAAFPSEGLFADKDWLLTPEPFTVSAKLAKQLEKLGHRLNLFNRACNELYQRSVSGKQPAWIADYLDRGKPERLIAHQRHAAQ